jgi:hypothetical protein
VVLVAEAVTVIPVEEVVAEEVNSN